MDRGNCSSVDKFIFSGITNNPDTKVALFITFLLVYLIALLVNLGMIILIRVDAQLHTPMYFFLTKKK
jgi:olfactory receptor